MEKHIDLLVEPYPQLECVKQSVIDDYLIMEECYSCDGKIMIAGNGGSAADSEHIVGELMKRFKALRLVNPELAEKFVAVDPVREPFLVKNLERSLMAIPLVAHEAFPQHISSMWMVMECSHSSNWDFDVQVMFFLAFLRLETARTL